MLEKMNKVVTAVERLHWIWSLVPSSGVALVTGWLGYLGDLPLMYIWVAMVVTFAFVIWMMHWLQTPTGKEKEKRDAFFLVCAELFRLTKNFNGNINPIYSALNHARVVFHEDEEVRSAFSRLTEDEGHDSVLIPDIIEAMGRAVSIKVDKKILGVPFSIKR